MKKLIISALTVILATISVGTAAYAWIGLSTINSIEGLSITASIGDELQISLDGIHYASHLESEDLSEVFRMIRLVDVTSINGIDFVRGGLKTGETAEANEHYLSFDLWFRSSVAEKNIYLVNNRSNKMSYGQEVEGTYVTSRGVEWTSDHTFIYGPDAEMVNKDSTHTYFAKDAARISVIERIDVSNTYDNRTEAELARFIFDPSENPIRGYGVPYGAINYFYNRTGLLSYRPGSIYPNTTYRLTAIDPYNPYQALDNDSRIMELIQTDFTDERGRTIYQGYVTVNIWIEGWDADAFDAVVGDILRIQLQFKALRTPEQT